MPQETTVCYKRQNKNTYVYTHRGAVRFHRTELRVRVLCIDGHGHMTSCLVPIKSTWSHFLTLQGKKHHTSENRCTSHHPDLMCVMPQLTVSVLHWCDPLLQPSWDRKELKSDVFLLQQLQYFILKCKYRCMLIKYTNKKGKAAPVQHCSYSKCSSPFVEDGHPRMI